MYSRYIDGGKSGDCLWTIDRDWTLLIEPTEDGGLLEDHDYDGWPWDYWVKKIRKVVIENGVAADRSMAAMFEGMENCSVFDVASLDISRVKNAENLFSGCTAVKDLTPLTGWDVSGIKNISGMFEGCTSLSDLSPLSGWNVGNIRQMDNLFKDCAGITDLSPLAGWDTRHIRDMTETFKGCTAVKDLTPLAGWDVSNVVNMSGTFKDCTGITDLSPLAGWDVSSVVNIPGTFKGCAGITDLFPLAGWDTGHVCNMKEMFDGCVLLSDTSAVESWDVGSLGDASHMFRGTPVEKNPLDAMIPAACPEKGCFTGWKKCQGNRIVKLLIPADARRSSAIGRKCRCDKAVVSEILGPHNEKLSCASSRYNSTFVYRKGETVFASGFDEDRFAECAPGIHFFMERQEAENY